MPIQQTGQFRYLVKPLSSSVSSCCLELVCSLLAVPPLTPLTVTFQRSEESSEFSWARGLEGGDCQRQQPSKSHGDRTRAS